LSAKDDRGGRLQDRVFLFGASCVAARPGSGGARSLDLLFVRPKAARPSFEQVCAARSTPTCFVRARRRPTALATRMNVQRTVRSFLGAPGAAAARFLIEDKDLATRGALTSSGKPWPARARGGAAQ